MSTPKHISDDGDLPKKDGTPRHMGVWVWRQFSAFFSALLVILIVGPFVALVKRQFKYRAFFAALVTWLVGVFSAGHFLVVNKALGNQWSVVAFWLSAMLVATCAGLLAARLAHDLAYWELYLAAIICGGVFFAHLFKGLPHLLGIATSPEYLDLMVSSPGRRLFGDLWDRTFFIAMPVGFILSVFGSSLAFVFGRGRGAPKGNKGLEWFVARRYLSSRKGSAVSMTASVAVLGIALGVAALVAVTAVMSGYQEDIQAKIMSTNAHLVVQKYGVDFTEYDEVASKALSVPGVLAASPFAFGEAMLSSGDNGVGVLIKGVRAESAPSVTDVEKNLCQTATAQGCERFSPADVNGQLATMLAQEDGLPRLILGFELMRRLGARVGDPVTLTTPVGIAGARGNAPRRLEYRIAGAFRSGMYEFDARLIYADLSAAQQLMGMGEAVSGVELRVARPEEVETYTTQVMSAIGRYPYRSMDWRELNRGIFTALKLQKVVMFLVLTFIVIVAAFNIASTLFMAVVEKGMDIAILKSMGAQDRSIMKIFVLEGQLVGLAGTILGVALGLLVCFILSRLEIGIAADVYMVESLVVRVKPLEILVTMFAAFVVSHLATLYPALKAARQRPVDTMRYE